MHLDPCIPIPLECDSSVNHVAFDGCDYFCTIRCKHEIIKFNPNSSELHRYCTCREYDDICYDYSENCFWVSSRTCTGKLFKLDCCMNEIDCISICALNQYGTITGISYNCCKNALDISFPCALIELEKYCDTFKVLYTAADDCIMGVLTICPGILITVSKDSQYYIYILNQCGRKIGCYPIDSPFTPRNLIFNPCVSACHKSHILAFILKENCDPYLCNTDISVEDFGFTPYCCNYKLCSECCCDKYFCPECDPYKDIMESIALIETALAHILNAEGEKIQKVLSTTDDLDKIMCVNREVNQTIVNITHLEHTLYDKLTALSDCHLCDEPCDTTICCDECNYLKNGFDDET